MAAERAFQPAMLFCNRLMHSPPCFVANLVQLLGDFVADQLRDKFPKLAAMLDRSEADVLAYMSPKAHSKRIHSTNPLERLNA
jgi:hypothetical protein